MGQAEQDTDLPRSASNVLGKIQYNLCLTEWRGKWKCRRGKLTLGAACPSQRIMFCNLCCTLMVQVRMAKKHELFSAVFLDNDRKKTKCSPVFSKKPQSFNNFSTDFQTQQKNRRQNIKKILLFFPKTAEFFPAVFDKTEDFFENILSPFFVQLVYFLPCVVDRANGETYAVLQMH